MALASLLARYNQWLTNYPVTTNGLTGCTIASLGDLMCQLGYETDKPYSLQRTLQMGVVRAAVMSPFLSVYFPFLNWLVPGKTMPRVLLRVVADQCIGSPVSIALMFAANGLIKGSPETILPRIKEHLVPTMINGAMYWPFVHTLNFRFVPLPHQPFVAHAASLWWNAILSYRANTVLGGEETAAAAGAAAAPAAPHGSAAVVAAAAALVESRVHGASAAVAAVAAARSPHEVHEDLVAMGAAAPDAGDAAHGGHKRGATAGASSAAATGTPGVGAQLR